MLVATLTDDGVSRPTRWSTPMGGLFCVSRTWTWQRPYAAYAVPRVIVGVQRGVLIYGRSFRLSGSAFVRDGLVRVVTCRACPFTPSARRVSSRWVG